MRSWREVRFPAAAMQFASSITVHFPLAVPANYWPLDLFMCSVPLDVITACALRRTAWRAPKARQSKAQVERSEAWEPIQIAPSPEGAERSQPTGVASHALAGLGALAWSNPGLTPGLSTGGPLVFGIANY